MPLPESTTSCSACGSTQSGRPSEGLCPVCLLSAVLTRGDMTGAAPMAEDLGSLRRCGEYEILGMIARGGMGVVYRARKLGLSREVALKMIAAADLAAPDEVRRFRLEAELIAHLDHPYIVPVYDVGEHDGRPFFVMKLAEGGTLAQRLAASSQLDTNATAAATMLKITRAVHHAHEHAVLHRDLKPANILLDNTGEPLVSDFGLARLANSPTASYATGAGVGTPAYMAPEQAQGQVVTTASDVYGLGAVFYHLLTGRPPFGGGSALEVLQRAATQDPVALQTINPAVDRDLATICLKALEKIPSRRYHSADDLADDLERWQRGEPVLARPAAWYERLWKWAKRRPAWATLLGAIFVGTAGLATLLVMGNVFLRGERNFALNQEKIAKMGTARAEASQHAMKLNLYSADIFLARRALDDGHLGVARQTLQRHVPKEGEPDLRGYEWYALEYQCQGDDRQVLTGHTSAVLAQTWSPDGAFMATGGRDGILKIWDTPTGAMIKELPDQPKLSKLPELAVLATLPMPSPEAGVLIGPGDGVSIDEMRVRARPSSLGDISALAWSPDGKLLATGGSGSYIRLWKTADWSMQGFLPVLSCQQLAFTQDSKQLVSASAGPQGALHRGEVRIYDLPSLVRAQTFPEVTACFALAPQGGLLALTRPGGEVQFHDLATGKIRSSLLLSEDASALSMSADGARLAVLQRRSGTLWDVARGRLIAGFSPQSGAFRCVTFSPNGQQFAAGGAGHLIQIFDGHLATPQTVWRGHDDELLALSFSPDGKSLLSASNDHTARVWSVTSSNHAQENLPERGPLVASSEDGTVLLADASDGSVHRWDVSQRKATASTPVGVARKALGVMPDHSRFATLRVGEGLLEWWHADGHPDGTAIRIPLGSESEYAVCPSQGWIAVANYHQAVHFYDWRTGAWIKDLPASPVRVNRLLFSPDGHWIVAKEWPRRIVVGDTTTGQWSPPTTISQGIVGPTVFSADSRWLASSGDDNLVTVRELATNQVLASLRGHKSEVKGLAFSSDGRTLASSSTDGTIHLWHTPTWRELGPLHHGPLCTQLYFTPQGLVAEEFLTQWLLIRGAATSS